MYIPIHFQKCSWKFSFETKVVLKQGCYIGPLLFSLFINNLKDYLDRGVCVVRVRIKMLMSDSTI